MIILLLQTVRLAGGQRGFRKMIKKLYFFLDYNTIRKINGVGIMRGRCLIVGIQLYYKGLCRRGKPLGGHNV